MEKIAAACAMDWSIDLDVGLRSSKPDKAMDALEEIGPRLRNLSNEVGTTAEISRMYGLVQGEDRTFVNTIILRLAEAFKNGDHQVRSHIINVFLIELRYIMKEGRRYDGILARHRIFNNLELLKRIKSVYDNGDVEARALSLRLFGCWCDLTRDNADVRHMILSSLQSAHAVEVKASLFAAGCICRLSDDFACIMVGALVDIIHSKALPEVKLSVAHTFSRMHCSYDVTNKAYKAARKLVLSLQFDEVASKILFALTKLATASPSLISEQVDFLLSVLSNEHISLIKATVLKCLLFLFSRGHHFRGSGSSLAALFHLVDEPLLPVKSQCNALCVLWKMAHSQQDLAYFDTPEFLKLVHVFESTAHSPIKSKSFLALSLLVDLICNAEKASSDYCPATCSSTLESFQISDLKLDANGFMILASHVSILAMDKITSLVNAADADTNRGLFVDVKAKRIDCKKILNLILRLLREYPQMYHMVLTHVISLIGEVLSKFGAPKKGTVHDCHHILMEGACDTSEIKKNELDSDKLNSPTKLLDGEEEYHDRLTPDIVVCLCRFTIACFKVLSSDSVATTEIFDTIKIFAEHLQESKFLNFVQYEIFNLQLHSCVMQHRFNNRNCEGLGSNESEVLADSYDLRWVQPEYLALQFARKMLKKNDSWALYRAGISFACDGLWIAAIFSFRKLVGRVQSKCNILWLQSLMLFAAAESQAKLLLSPKVSVPIISWLHTDDACGETWAEISKKICYISDGSLNLHDYGGNISGVLTKFNSSSEALATVMAIDGLLYFQWWFLTVRSRCFEVVKDIIVLLNAQSCYAYEDCCCMSDKENARICHTMLAQNSLARRLSFFSLQLNKLAKEYDLLSTSFLNIDVSSSSILSQLALGCSLLAFSALFPLLSSEESSCSQLHSMLLQDLVERLWDIDNESVTNLLKYLAPSSEFGGCLQLQSHLSCSGIPDEATISLCKLVISSICKFYADSKRGQSCGNYCQSFEYKVAQGGENPSQNCKGMQFLSKIVGEWIGVPFKTPRYFFETRPCVSAELFVFSTSSRIRDRISTISGMQLSLDLCLQLKNVAMSSHRKITEVNCLLASSPSLRNLDQKQSEEKLRMAGYQYLEGGLLVGLNEKLLLLMRNDVEASISDQDLGTGTNDWVTTYVRFKLNETGQGFSTCLLDASSFPEGYYQMYWHSCCVDDRGSYWTLPSVNRHFFRINRSSAT